MSRNPSEPAETDGDATRPAARLADAIADLIESLAGWIRRAFEEDAADPDADPGDEPGDGYAVTGTVRRGEEPIAGATVRAFDRGPDGEAPLGETVTGDDGQYRIAYSEAGPGNGRGPVVRVYGEAGERVAEAPVEHGGRREATVDFRLPAGQREATSEFARLQSAVDAALGSRSITDLSDDGLASLRERLSSREGLPADERTFRQLRTAEDLAARTPFDAPVLYALAGGIDGLDRARLAEADPARLAEVVAAADEKGVVEVRTGGLEERLARAVERLRQTKRLEDGEVGRTTVTVATAYGDPLAGTAVRVEVPGEEGVQRTFRTDENGEIALSYLRPPEGDGSREVRLTPVNDAGVELAERTVTVGTVGDGDGDGGDGGQVAEVTVPGPAAGFSGAATLEALRSEHDLRLSDLGDLSGETLGAVRRAGGVENLDASASLDAETREVVDAVAALDLVADPATGGALAEHGFTDQFAIAGTSLAEFKSATEGALDPEKAATVHAKARAQTHLLDGLLADGLAAYRNGTAHPGVASAGEVRTDVE